MGNNVTTTPVEPLKIDEINDIGNNDHHYNTHAINDNTYEGFNVHSQSKYPEQYSHENWNEYDQQYVEFNQNINQNNEEVEENHLSINERLRERKDSVPDFTDEGDDVLSEMKDSKPVTDLNVGIKPIVTKSTFDRSLPLLKRSIEDNNDLQEIDDLESIDSSSRLYLNDAKSDTEEVIQELNKLDLDLEEPSDRYRRRGQSWSNWDNNVHDRDLKAESSMSSFSRPTSINDIQSINGIKTKSYTAPESRHQIKDDTAIEWLAKQHGLEIGITLDHDIKHKTNERTVNRNDMKLTSFEIPGSVASLTSTPAAKENEIHEKYDELEKQIINSIENDFIR